MLIKKKKKPQNKTTKNSQQTKLETWSEIYSVYLTNPAYANNPQIWVKTGTCSPCIDIAYLLFQ